MFWVKNSSMRNKNLRVKGISIAFLGPDGSGKSTIISGLLDKDLPFERSDYFHLKPFKQKEGIVNPVVQDPHKNAPYGVLKSYFKLLVFIVQYNYGWVKNINPLLGKSSLIIFDRYYDDLLVDFRRYRYGGSLKIAKWVSNLIPKPDLCFILTAESDIIYQRKQEVSLEELKRQIMGYRTLIDGERYIDIDVSRSPNEIVSQIRMIIQKKMNGE